MFIALGHGILFFLCLAGAELLADLIPFYLVKLCGEIFLPSAPPAGYAADLFAFAGFIVSTRLFVPARML